VPLYDFKCNDCGLVAELQRPMAQSSASFICSCGGQMHRIFTSYPHTELNWKAYDRNDTGSDRMIIGATHTGANRPIDDRAQKYKVVIHDDVRQSTR
jgi:putative FmdB family regulatory protein